MTNASDLPGPDGDADTGMAEAAAATAMPSAADPESIPAAAASRGGLPPLVWGGLLILGVAALLAWQLA